MPHPPSEPVPASHFTAAPLPEGSKALLVRSGLVPYNDKFHPLWYDKDYKVFLAFGGRGGGKSEAVVDKLITDCMEQAYFKCYYGRKVFDTVRESCFATIVSAIKKRGLEKFFKFSEADNSAMTIIYTLNGNRFVPFGSDKADKLKSIKDPSVIWCEEFDQFTEEDFKAIYPTLRTPKGQNILYACFNTHGVFTDHWLIKVFFPEIYTPNLTPSTAPTQQDPDDPSSSPLQGVKVCKVFINYSDNYFIDREAYKERLWLACGGHKPTFDGVANGAWGVVENDNPWLYSWSVERNTQQAIPLLKGFPVYLSFDFNNDPFACTAWQFHERRGDPDLSFIHCIKEFTGNYKLEQMCDRIRATFPNQVLIITGDRSGQNEDLGRNQTLYQMIAAKLGISNKALRLNNTNLEHADSRIFCNVMLANYPNFYISRAGCPQLIKQCGIATIDTQAAKPHQLRKDRGVYKMDEFDSMRYFLQTFFHEYAKNKYLRIQALRK